MYGIETDLISSQNIASLHDYFKLINLLFYINALHLRGVIINMGIISFREGERNTKLFLWN